MTSRTGRRRAPGRTRSRGVALLLVVIALAVATVLSLTFASAQSTTIGIARNLDRHARARTIAESGLALAVRETQANDGWRERGEGEWLTAAFGGGAFTIEALDGRDLDGDGVLSLADAETDGDLADDTADPVTFTVTGTFGGVAHRIRACVVPGAPTGGGGSGAVPAGSVFATGTVRLQGSARIDSYDSTAGPYGWSNSGRDATVVSSSTDDDAVEATGSAEYRGDVYVGVGGDPGSVFDGWGSGGVTGQVRPLPAAIDPPAVPEHGINIPSRGNVNASGAPGAVFLPAAGSGGVDRVNHLNGGGAKSFRVRGDLRLRVDGDVRIGGASGLELEPGASLTMWVAGDVDFGAGIRVNGDTKDPTRLVIYVTGANSRVEISGSADVHAAIIAPQASLAVDGSAELYGTFQGESILVRGTAAIHQDLGLGDIPGLITTGGGPTSGRSVHWIENP